MSAQNTNKFDVNAAVVAIMGEIIMAMGNALIGEKSIEFALGNATTEVNIAKHLTKGSEEQVKWVRARVTQLMTDAHFGITIKENKAIVSIVQKK